MWSGITSYIITNGTSFHPIWDLSWNTELASTPGWGTWTKLYYLSLPQLHTFSNTILVSLSDSCYWLNSVIFQRHRKEVIRDELLLRAYLANLFLFAYNPLNKKDGHPGTITMLMHTDVKKGFCFLIISRWWRFYMDIVGYANISARIIYENNLEHRNMLSKLFLMERSSFFQMGMQIEPAKHWSLINGKNGFHLPF